MQENQRENSIIKARISQYLDHKGITKYAFYRASGTTTGILSQSNGISEENLLRFLANYKDINLDWLLRGEGVMTTSPRPIPSIYPTIDEDFTSNVADVCTSTAHYADERQIQQQTLTLHDTPSVASLLLAFDQPTSANSLTVVGLPLCDGALRIHGTALEPTLRAGDVVLYKRLSPQEIVCGTSYLIVRDVNEQPVVQLHTLYTSSTPGYLRLDTPDSSRAGIQLPISQLRAVAQICATIRYNHE